jgi:hypothetical protein
MQQRTLLGAREVRDLVAVVQGDAGARNRAQRAATGLGLLIAVSAAGVWVDLPSLRRGLVAAVVAGVILVLVVRDPRVGLLVLVAGLPFLALTRRVLISDSAWTSRDPLLLVTPLVMGFLMVHLYVMERRRPKLDLLWRLCAVLCAIAVADVFNPSGGGIRVGLGGLLFFLVPMLWFFAGWELADEHLIESIMHVVIVVAVLNAVYGLAQTSIGWPSWDQAWLHAVGPLLVSIPSTHGIAMRPIGSLSSPQEYLALLAIGAVFSVALARRQRWLLLTLPLFGVALFYGSGRSQLVLVVVAIALMAPMMILRGRMAAVGVGCSVALVVAGFIALRPVLSHVAAQSSNPLVQHQASGLANPLSSSSTFGTHLSAFEKGIADGFVHPFGLGTGSSTIAADVLGNGANRTKVVFEGFTESIRGTDTDVSNVFESFGFIGGGVYLAILAILAMRLLRRYLLLRDPVTLAVIGLGIVMTLQWLRSGLYAVSAVTWFMFGWAARPGAGTATTSLGMRWRNSRIRRAPMA